MNHIPISYEGKSESDVMKDVLSEVFNESHFAGGTESIEPSEGTEWGEPNSWYTMDGKFTYKFATIRTDDWLQIHKNLNHHPDGAYQPTVEWVEKQIRESKTDEIPTPTLALEPEDFGVDNLEYKPVREGRSRGVGAREAGLERIPILVSVRRPRK